MAKSVAILMGGWSVEREVSLVSGDSVAKGLAGSGFNVKTIDLRRNADELLKHLNPKPDIVFNALHGRYGEDGCIQGILNILGVPYTHSGVLASAIAMNKPMAKNILSAVGIKTAAHQILKLENLHKNIDWDPPYVVKPLNEGSSVGVSIITNENKSTLRDIILPVSDLVMIEKYIPGRELTVAVMGGRPLAVTEVDTNQTFYDYDAKYLKDGSEHIVPADLPAEVYDEAMKMAVIAHETLGCRGITRSDFRYDGSDIYFLEVNTQPGMTPTSLVPEQALYANISFEELVTWLVEHAECD